MQRFHVDGWRGRVRSRLRPEHPGRPLQELSLPGRDLVGMNVKLLRQFGQRLLTPYGSQGHLRFESRRVVPAWSSAHRFSCSAAILAAVRQKLHLSNLFKNPEPALYCGHVIPTCIEDYALAQSRRPMDMMIQGWSIRRFHA